MEILEDEDKYTLKVLCKPEYLMLASDIEDDFYLGDKVIIEGDYKITKINREIN
ncbi:MAG: hypothetical protein GY834_03370 [Bacteroidetes bacterium]|nr:hypothetical protein [Bacteroidota bacterium]